eukprot:3162754-Amphidinium_carterae.1
MLQFLQTRQLKAQTKCPMNSGLFWFDQFGAASVIFVSCRSTDNCISRSDIGTYIEAPPAP